MKIFRLISLHSIALFVVIVLSILIVVCGVALAAVEIPVDSTELGKSERDALHSTIVLLEWGLVSVAVSLAGALVILWRSSAAKDTTILAEVKNAQPAREEQLKSNLAVTEAMNGVSETMKEFLHEIQFCKERRTREELLKEKNV